MKKSLKTIIFGSFCVIFGYFTGVLSTNLRHISGTLVVDTSDENKDVYRLEINDLDSIPFKKKIVLNISPSRK